MSILTFSCYLVRKQRTESSEEILLGEHIDSEDESLIDTPTDSGNLNQLFFVYVMFSPPKQSSFFFFLFFSHDFLKSFIVGHPDIEERNHSPNLVSSAFLGFF